MPWTRVGQTTIHDGQRGWIHKRAEFGLTFYSAYIDAEFLGAFLSRDRAEQAIKNAHKTINIDKKTIKNQK
jgi:hypothetical protein